MDNVQKDCMLCENTYNAPKRDNSEICYNCSEARDVLKQRNTLANSEAIRLKNQKEWEL